MYICIYDICIYIICIYIYILYMIYVYGHRYVQCIYAYRYSLNPHDTKLP